MSEYSKLAIDTFLKNQSQLFDANVANTPAEAEDFLEDCCAIEVDSIKEVRDCLEEMGMDASDMSDEELNEASEIFALSNGKYLVVEG